MLYPVDVTEKGQCTYLSYLRTLICISESVAFLSEKTCVRATPELYQSACSYKELQLLFSTSAYMRTRAVLEEIER